MSKRGGLVHSGGALLSWFLSGSRFDRRGGGSARTFLGRKEEIDIHDYFALVGALINILEWW